VHGFGGLRQPIARALENAVHLIVNLMVERSEASLDCTDVEFCCE
jgi:hypothetical protein